MPTALRPPNYRIGQKFGLLTILSLRYVPKPSGKSIYKAMCRCDCGREKEIFLFNVVKGNTKSCGCLRVQYLKITGKNNNKFRGHEDIRLGFWNANKAGALLRGIPFKITIEYGWGVYEAQGRKCALSGVPVHFAPLLKQRRTTASLDRIDSSQGYVEGNIQWVHKVVNVMRNTLSVGEFASWCLLVANHLKGQELTSSQYSDDQTPLHESSGTHRTRQRHPKDE